MLYLFKYNVYDKIAKITYPSQISSKVDGDSHLFTATPSYDGVDGATYGKEAKNTVYLDGSTQHKHLPGGPMIHCLSFG